MAFEIHWSRQKAKIVVIRSAKNEIAEFQIAIDFTGLAKPMEYIWSQETGQASLVKNPPAIGQKFPLEKEMANITPVFFPGKSEGQRSLVGYSPWGAKE